jgi:cysteine desulfurase
MDRAAPEPIYLDHNATTPMAPQVADAMDRAMRAGYANPASQHELGRRARRTIESARTQIVELLGGETSGRLPDRLIFTSGGTEANNLALLGMAPGHADGGNRLITSPIEHPSVAAAAEQLARHGWQVDRLGVTPSGVVDADSLQSLLHPHTRLVSVMLGNNETGALQPIAALAAEAGECGVPLHTDAVQAVGKIDVHFRRLGAAAMSFTAHKFHGPVGIGGLLVRGHVDLQPQLFGGFQQAGVRPGTESVPLVVGMQAALELWHAERDARRERLTSLRNRLEQQLTAGRPNTLVVAADAVRLPHTTNIAFVGLDRQALFVALDLEGIACSTGSACASGSSEPSPVLVAMGCGEGVIRGSLRLSLGTGTTPGQIDEAARRILLVCKRLEQQKGA